MLTKSIKKMPAILALGLMLLLGANYASFGQKGHGNGGGNGNGNGNGGGKHADKRGDEGGNGNGRQKHDVERQQVPQGYVVQGNNGRGNGNGNGNGNGKWKQRDENRPVYTAPYQQPAPYYGGGGWVPPGQIRSQQVHERNAERKALKDQEKAYRRDMNLQRYDPRYSAPQWIDRAQRIYQDNYAARQRSYDPNRYGYSQVVPVNPYQPNGYYNYPNTYGYNQGQYYYNQNPYLINTYSQDPYGYNTGGSLKSTLLRTLISAVLGGLGGGNNNNYYANQYDPYANGPVRYDYYNQPAYYGGGYTPQYPVYTPAYSQYGSYGQPQYVGYSPYSGGLLGASPLAGVFGQQGGGSYVTQMLSQVLAQGYLQGSLAGQTARQSGYGSRYYDDPYDAPVNGYVPYSHSIDENRQLLSEGYNLGFRDALSGRRNQYQPQSVGNADLVSLLLSNVLRLG